MIVDVCVIVGVCVIVIIAIIAIIAIIDMLVYNYDSIENYSPCMDCDGYKIPRNGISVLNPYVYPYSGTQCVDNLYILNKDIGTDFNFAKGPLTQASDPDHIILTN